MASFTLAAWVVPAANQAFRVSMSHGRPIARGVSELTLGEIRQQLKSRTPRLAAGAANSLAVNYHLRWALGSAPFVLTLFTVALMSRRQWGRMIPLLVGCLVVLTYPFMMYSTGRLELHQTISPLAAAWTPNAAFLALSLAIVMFTSRRTNAIPHA
jgi:lipopolysaccharide export LptBFGC system permease protein LptF